MIKILYEKDHENRAKTLAGIYPNDKDNFNAECSPIDEPPVTIKGDDKLDTLVLFGHSGRSSDPTLCGKSMTQIKDIVKGWKSKNSSLKTVEILTCDGRHADDGHEPIATAVKNKLHGAFSSTKKVVVKALPTAITGKNSAFSILLADWETKSWCYICAPTNSDMFFVRHTMEIIALNNFPDPQGRSGSGDLAQAANKLAGKFGEDNIKAILKEYAKKDLDTVKKYGAGIVRLIGENRNYSLNYGYFNTLRAQLGVVKSTSFSVASRLHEFDAELLDELEKYEPYEP